MTHGDKGSDHPFRDSPWVERLPPAIRRVVYGLTYDEAHAMELGLIGIPLTALYLINGPITELAATTMGLVLLLVALFKLPRESGTFSKLLSRETWYFAVVFVVSSVLTAVLM